MRSEILNTLCIMHTTWPSNTYINKAIICVCYSLKNHGVPSFSVIVICMVINWGSHGDMTSTDCSHTLRYSLFRMEGINHSLQLLARWEFNVHTQKTIHNRLACFMYNFAYRRPGNVKQVIYSAVFSWCCQAPKSSLMNRYRPSHDCVPSPQHRR